MMHRSLCLLVSVLVLAGCQSQSGNETAASAVHAAARTPDPSAASITSERVPPIDFDGFDRSVRPQDDFERYVNGGWYRKTEMPADRGRYGIFAMLEDRASEQVRAIIEEIAARDDLEPGSDGQKIRDLFLSFMDEAGIEARGLSGLKPEFDAIDAIGSTTELAALFGEMSLRGGGHPLGLWIGQDLGEPERYTVYLSQSGLSLADRAFYLEDSPQMAGIQQGFREYLERIFGLLEHPDPADAAKRVFAVEQAIARHHWTRVANRDRNRTYNPVDAAGLRALAPEFAWDAFLAPLGLEAREDFIVRQPSFVEGFAQLLGEIPLADWQDYLRARVVTAAAEHLPAAFAEARFDFFGRRLQGLEAQQPRWRRGVNLVNASIGELVGKEYVARHFPPEAKARMMELVANVKQAMRESLETLDWMTESTRAEALAKLESFNTKIGYPDVWRDYSALEIRPDDLLGNLRRVQEFAIQRRLAQLDGPIDRSEWSMTPQTVNAYYSPSLNEIVFPAAILQPPFFNLDADDAVNYGAIGMVIGHEIGHGFDDQGRRTDGQGRLRDWWTPEDEAEFVRRTDRLVEQYSAFNPIDDLHIDGRLSLGENIGDLGGIALAYRAWRLSLNGVEPEPIDGYTGAQRFFIAFAQIWRSKYRDDALRQHLRTGPHAPPRYRVMGVLPNFTPFYEAFDVQPGDAMYRLAEQRVSIW